MNRPHPASEDDFRIKLVARLIESCRSESWEAQQFRVTELHPPGLRCESSATHSTKAYFDCALRNGTVGLIQNQRLEFPKYGVVGNFRPSRLIRPPLYRYCDFAGTVDSMKFGRGGFEPDGIMPVCLRERDGLQANTLDGRVADQRGTDARLILI